MTLPGHRTFGQDLQCGLVHLWVRDLMVAMLMEVISPGGGGCPGRAAFTKVLERVDLEAEHGNNTYILRMRS